MIIKVDSADCITVLSVQCTLALCVYCTLLTDSVISSLWTVNVMILQPGLGPNVFI